MLKKAITGCVLFWFLNGLFGCSGVTTVKIFKEDLLPVSPTKIVGLKMIAGEEIRFGEWGGQYDAKNRIFEGRSPDGRPVEIEARNVRWVWVEKTEAGKTSLVQYRIEAFRSQEETHGEITAVIMPSGEQITFDKRGGYLDVKTKMILGTTQDGRFMSIDLDDVLCAEVKKVDPLLSFVKTSSCLIGGAGSLLILIVGIQMSQDPYF